MTKFYTGPNWNKCRQHFKLNLKWKISTIQGRKHCEKRRNCLLQAIFPFLAMFCNFSFSHNVFHSYYIFSASKCSIVWWRVKGSISVIFSILQYLTLPLLRQNAYCFRSEVIILIDGKVFNIIFNIISLILQPPKHLSIIPCSFLNQFFTSCFPSWPSLIQ